MLCQHEDKFFLVPFSKYVNVENICNTLVSVFRLVRRVRCCTSVSLWLRRANCGWDVLASLLAWGWKSGFKRDLKPRFGWNSGFEYSEKVEKRRKGWLKLKTEVAWVDEHGCYCIQVTLTVTDLLVAKKKKQGGKKTSWRSITQWVLW